MTPDLVTHLATERHRFWRVQVFTTWWQWLISTGIELWLVATQLEVKFMAIWPMSAI